MVDFFWQTASSWNHAAWTFKALRKRCDFSLVAAITYKTHEASCFVCFLIFLVWFRALHFNFLQQKIEEIQFMQKWSVMEIPGLRFYVQNKIDSLEFGGVSTSVPALGSISSRFPGGRYYFRVGQKRRCYRRLFSLLLGTFLRSCIASSLIAQLKAVKMIGMKSETASHATGRSKISSKSMRRAITLSSSKTLNLFFFQRWSLCSGREDGDVFWLPSCSSGRKAKCQIRGHTLQALWKHVSFRPYRANGPVLICLN